MASWKEERDRLVAQTLAFVQQVAAARPHSHGTPAAGCDQVPGLTVDAPAEPVAVDLRHDLAHRLPPVSERSDILQRVAAFRAQQDRVSRDREAFYEKMQARIRLSLGNDSDATRL